MNIPTIQGIIKRRILVNYRADESVIQKLLPVRFRPKLHNGEAVVGICLIRLEHARPKFMPEFLGFASENAAHRIAVVWEDEDDITQEGVYVPRRDTDSLINTTVGGKLFSGVYHRAKFKVEENENELDFEMKSADQKIAVSFTGEISDDFPKTSIFSSLNEASKFFEAGSLGFSAAKNIKKLDGIVLQIDDWKVSPFKITSVHSSFYDDELIFPKNSIEFDHALYMHNIAHEWHSAKSFDLD